jgi:FkbM family methyltransferase
MSFISYAQNREDVLLWRALGHIKNGFYIDVGANEPEQDSVTWAFYQRGWWGINVEPVPGLHRRLQEARPRDINLGVAAGATAAEITLFDLPEVNGWATASAEVAASHRADGHNVVESRVPVRTLNDICAEHVRGDIHFLKIDVEGFEEEVLRGIDLARWRPWIVVVEATMPNSRETSHARWDPLVSEHGYRFAWFDGLNRYYVADEHAELVAVLAAPPNVFDDFIPSQLDTAWRQLTELGRLHEAASLDAYNAKAQAAQREAQLAHSHASELKDLAAEAAKVRAERESAIAASLTALETANAAIAQLGEATQRAHEAELALDTLRQRSAEDEAELAMLHAEHARASAWALGLEQRLNATLASTSWRVTGPLRTVGGLRHRAAELAPRVLLRRAALHAMRTPRLRLLALRLMRRFPALAPLVREQVSALVHPAQPASTAQYVPPPHLINVPVSARKVLDDLMQQRANQSSGLS